MEAPNLFLFLTERLAHRTFGLPRQAMLRAALRGEIAYRRGADGRVEFRASDVHAYAHQRAADDGRARAEATSPRSGSRR